MSVCEFCEALFSPRPQVKNPRACSNDCCQKKRQRLNEKTWRERHPELYGKEYFAGQKETRARVLEGLAAIVSSCFKTGAILIGVDMDWTAVRKEFENLFLQLGLRRVNKFWSEQNRLSIQGLAVPG